MSTLIGRIIPMGKSSSPFKKGDIYLYKTSTTADIYIALQDTEIAPPTDSTNGSLLGEIPQGEKGDKGQMHDPTIIAHVYINMLFVPTTSSYCFPIQAHLNTGNQSYDGFQSSMPFTMQNLYSAIGSTNSGGKSFTLNYDGLHFIDATGQLSTISNNGTITRNQYQIQPTTTPEIYPFANTDILDFTSDYTLILKGGTLE